jgi:hypothetical protein
MLHIDRERIRKALDEFKTLQLESDLGRVIDISKFNEVFFGNLSVSEFILHSKRAINILEQSIRSENYKFLPIFANFNNEFGNGNLADNLVSLIRNIKNKDFDSASKQLGFIIHYINVNNLSNNIESHSNERIKYFVDLEDKLIKFSKQLEESIKKSNSSISDIENERKEFTKVIAASKKNLLAAQELLNGIKDKDNVINEKIVKAMENSERIIQMDRDIFKKRENLAKQLEDQLTNQINEYNKTKLDLTEIERMKAKSIEDDNIIKKALEDVNSYDIQFKERLAELNELIGKEAAVSLFYTFKERKKELNFSLIGWAIMTLLIGFVSAYFIWEVIKVQEAQFKENNGVNLNIFLYSSFKTLPFLIILYFCIRQYNVERRFQEEYAFRHAVALTIKAYSDIAGDKKDELVELGVRNLYTTPSSMKEKSSFGLFRTKELSETLKNINDTLSKNKIV